MLKFSAWLACGTGVVLAVAMTVLNRDGLETDVYYVLTTPVFTSATYISAILLVWGGLITLRRLRRGPALLAAGWGFALGMSFLAFEPINWYFLSEFYAVGLSASLQTYLVGVAVLMVIAVIGLTLAVLGVTRAQ